MIKQTMLSFADLRAEGKEARNRSLVGPRPVASKALAMPYQESCETRRWTSPAIAIQNTKKLLVFSDEILRRATSSRGSPFRNSQESLFLQVREHALLPLAIPSG